MSADIQAPAPRVTLDDLKHQAEALRDQAVTEAKDTAKTVMGPERKKALMVAAGVALVVVSIAYFAGTRSGRATASRQLMGE